MAQQDVVDLPRLALVLGIGIVMTLIGVGGGQAIYLAGEQRQFEKKDLDHKSVEITELKAKQMMQLESYGVVDKEKRLVSIPIDLAMQQELKAR